MKQDYDYPNTTGGSGTGEIPKPKVHLSGIGYIPDPQAFLLGLLSERGVKSLELIADALQTLAKVESERLRHEYPDPREAKHAQVNRASDDKREQFSDKPSQEWVEETMRAFPPSRFQKKFDEDQKAEGARQAAKK